MKKVKRKTFLILLIVVGSFACIYGFTLAKYVSNSVWDYYLRSKGFYFNSDYLGSNLVKNVNNTWDGGSVNFNIRNNLNQTVITDYDIGYSTVCTVLGEATSYAECHLNGTTSNTENGILSSYQACSNTKDDGVDVSLLNKTDCELGGYEWINQIAVKNLYFDVVLTDNNYEISDVIINITVTSTSPYTKTLSGQFTLHKGTAAEANVTIDYKNFANYDRLVVSNSYASNKCVKVSWDANKLIINANASDFSSYGVNENGYINEITFNIGAKGSLSYIFYKRNFDTTYGVSEFTIVETGGC